MTRSCMCFTLAVAALLPAFAPPSVARAQAKPAMVISLAGVKENLDDIAYLTRAADVPDAGKTAVLFGGAFTQGIDKTRPVAIVITPDAGDFQSVACIPVADLEKVMETLKGQGLEPTEVEGGIKEFGDGKFFVKSVGGWAYVAQQKGWLGTMPADPAALLGDLPKKYNAAVSINVRNIPEEHRKWAVEQIKSGFEQGQARIKADTPEEREAQEKVARSAVQGVIDLVEQAETLQLGLAIDPTDKKTYLDVSLTVIEGSKLAQELAAQSAAKSAFGGFLQPDGAVQFHVAAKLAPSDVAQIQSLLKGARTKALQEIDDNPKFDAAQRTAVKDVTSSFLDIVGKSVESGLLNGGALVKVGDKVDFAAGGFIADGAQMEAAFRKLVDAGKSDPDFPSVKLNAGEHAGVKYHRLTAPTPGDAKVFFGDKMDILVGIGGKSAYIAGGPNCETLLKKVIDQSASGASTVEGQPMHLALSIGSILKMVNLKEQDALITDMVDTLAKTAGNDHVRIHSKLIPRGSVTRLEVDEGVLKLIGVGLKKGGVGLQPNAF